MELILGEMQKNQLATTEIFDTAFKGMQSSFGDILKKADDQNGELVKAVTAAGGEYSKVTAEATAGQMKALLGKEVLKMFEEVGRIRESKRSLEHELAELFRLKAKYTPGRPPARPPTGGPSGPASKAGSVAGSAPASNKPPPQRPALPIPRR